MTLLVSYDLISDRHILAPFPDKTLHRLPGCARSRGAHRTAFRGAEIPKRPGDSLASETRSGGGVASQSARVHPFSPRQARRTSASPPARSPHPPPPRPELRRLPVRPLPLARPGRRRPRWAARTCSSRSTPASSASSVRAPPLLASP